MRRQTNLVLQLIHRKLLTHHHFPKPNPATDPQPSAKIVSLSLLSHVVLTGQIGV
jgi:hypothetical protein